MQRGGQLKLRDATHGSQPVRFVRMTSNVEMAGKNYQVTYASIEDMKVPYKFILGEGRSSPVQCERSDAQRDNGSKDEHEYLP